MAEQYFVYILASRRNGTLYTGVTNDLSRRIAEHNRASWRGSPALMV
jgi:putative endonuclease